MKRIFDAKWLLLFVIMFSLTTVNADAQRRPRQPRQRSSSGVSRSSLLQVMVLPEGGYTNLRATPGGRVIGKVKDGSYIYMNKRNTLDPPEWIKIYTSSGKFRGYMHVSKICGTPGWGELFGYSEFGGGTSW